jgi:hypothetical protein
MAIPTAPTGQVLPIAHPPLGQSDAEVQSDWWAETWGKVVSAGVSLPIVAEVPGIGKAGVEPL